MTRVVRHTVPLTARTITLQLSGAVLHVDCRDRDAVEVWTCDSGGPKTDRTFTIVGTGQPWPPGDWQHVATALSPALPPFGPRGALVWHLLERHP